MKRIHAGSRGSNPTSVSAIPDIQRQRVRDEYDILPGCNVCVALKQLVLEITLLWIVDRCRISPDGQATNYFNEWLSWEVAAQISRSMHPGRPNVYAMRVDIYRPNFGILVSKLDWKMWVWFRDYASAEPFKWYPPEGEPEDIHHQEYVEIPAVNLKGQFSAFKKMPDLNS